MINMVKVCQNCGFRNEFYESVCVNCLLSLKGIPPTDASELDLELEVFVPQEILLVNRDLMSGKPIEVINPVTGKMELQTVLIPSENGLYVVGRDSENFIPAINIKDFSIPYTTPDPTDPRVRVKQRGISREHAVILRFGDRLFIYRHPNASQNLPLKVGDAVITGTTEEEAVEIFNNTIITLGDVFPPGSKDRAPGVVVQVKFPPGN